MRKLSVEDVNKVKGYILNSWEKAATELIKADIPLMDAVLMVYELNKEVANIYIEGSVNILSGKAITKENEVDE
jgi:hypothetical protein